MVVTMLMRVSASKGEFERLFTRAFPKGQMELPGVLDVDEKLQK
jgi:hypothetical protein